ncbi:MAG TPA: tetratricopeptide repeat protein, partial [Dehalococcoidales bacterium]
KAVDILTSFQVPASLTGDAYRRLGDICLEQGQLREALKHQKAALKYYDQSFDLALTSQVHNSLGVIYRRLGELDKGSFHFEQAREGWQKLKNYAALSMTLNNIGIIYKRKGQYDLAMECLNLGLEKARETGYERLETCIRISMGEVLRDIGKYPEALTHFQAGLEGAREIIEPYLVSYATAGMGEIYRLLGDPDKAEVVLKDALIESETRKRSYESALIGLQLALVESETGQFDQAIERLNKCCAVLEEAGELEALARGYFHLAHISFLKGQNDGIKQCIEKLEGLVQKLGYDNFLVVEGRDAVLLLQHCVTNQLGVQLFSRILGKIKTLPRSTRRPTNRAAFFFAQAENKLTIKISALREIKVEVSGRPVSDNEWRSKRARELFLYLLITGKSQTREQICAAIWPDLNISRGTSNFHINLYRARKAIFADVFTYLDGKYAINPDINIKFDVREFDELVQKAFQMPDSSSKLACLGKALEVYQGSLAPEIYSEWIEPHRRRLEDIYVKTLFLCSEGYAEIRDYEKAMQSVEKIISCDPYNDIAYTKLMEYQINSGDKTSALMTYHKYIDNVTQDLNSTSPKIQSLYRSLVNQ